MPIIYNDVTKNNSEEDMKSDREYCEEAREIGGIWDAAVAYCADPSPKNRRCLIKALKGWKHQPDNAVFPCSQAGRERFEW